MASDQSSPGNESCCSPSVPRLRRSNSSARRASPRDPRERCRTRRVRPAPAARQRDQPFQPGRRRVLRAGPVLQRQPGRGQDAGDADRVDDAARPLTHARGPRVARRVIAGHGHVEAELAGQILPPGPRQQQPRAHRASRWKAARAPVRGRGGVAVVEHGGGRQQQAVVERRSRAAPAPRAVRGRCSPWHSQQVMPISPLGVPSGRSASRRPSTPVDAEMRPTRPRGSSGVGVRPNSAGFASTPPLAWMWRVTCVSGRPSPSRSTGSRSKSMSTSRSQAIPASAVQ